MSEHYDHEIRASQYDPASPGGLDVRMILLVGAIGAALFIAIAFALEAAFVSIERSTMERNYRMVPSQGAVQIRQQDAQINSMNRIEGTKDYVTVPIDLAIEEFAKQAAPTAAR